MSGDSGDVKTPSGRALGSLVHRHRHEDEYSVVLAGRAGVQAVEAGPGRA